MSSQLDLSFVSLYRLGGQEWPLLPGLLAMNPPRRPARGRDNDRLVIYLHLAGNIRFTTAEYAEITRQMSERFYQSTGSLTNALRTASESINAFILDRNLRLSGSGQAITGLLVIGALRDKTFSFAISGPTHLFLMSEGTVTHFSDQGLAGRGLGFMQTVRLYYAQIELRPGDRMVVGAQIADGWEADLAADRSGASIDVTRRRLLTTAAPNLNAALVSAQPGKGEMILLKPAMQETPPDAQPAAKPAAASTPPAAPTAQPSAPRSAAAAAPAKLSAPPPSVPAKSTVSPQPSAPGHTAVSSALPPPSRQGTGPVRPPNTAGTPGPLARSTPAGGPPAPAATVRPPQPSGAGRGVASTTARDGKSAAREDSSPEPKELIRAPGPKRSQQAFKTLAGLLRGLRAFGEKISHGLQVMIPRILPGTPGGDAAPRFSTNVMMVVAIGVPLIVVAIALVVYNEIGVREQYGIYYQQAEQAAVQTVSQKDPAEVRRAWETTLYWLDKAEAYQQTSQSRALRRQAQLSLDGLDRIIRLDFRPAIAGGLSRNVQITRMAASDTDVFMLNAARGNVMRVFLTGTGYTLDPNFHCEPGVYSGVRVGPLLDLVALPRVNPLGATVAGIDADGNLLYCIPNGDPQAMPLAPPDTSWVKITAVAFDNNNLYVLDAPANAVWTYIGDQGMFPDRPTFFFGPQVPQMGDVLGLAVNADDLYLLHADGHLSYCTLSRLEAAPTRCIDPATLTDSRPGHQSGATLADAVFTQIVFTAPPDSSVALLEAHTQAIYRFSSRVLELQNQLRAYPGSENPLPASPVSAMAIAPNHVLFLLIEGQLYYASTVPQ